MDEVVSRKLNFVAIGGQASGLRHDSRVGHEDIQAREVGEDFVSGGRDGRQAGEVACYECDGGCSSGLLNALSDCFGGFDVAACEDSVAWIVL